MAKPGDLKVGDFVRCDSSGGSANGKIERIETSGSINVPDSSFTIEASEDNPAALIQLFRDGEATDRRVGHRFSSLTKIQSPKAMQLFKAKSAGFQIKDMDMRKGIVELYASVFDVVDSDNDRMKAGCFAKSIDEMGPEGSNRIIHLYQHNPDMPMGRPVKMEETKEGLLCQSYISEMKNGDYRKMYTEGLIKEHSIGFMSTEGGMTENKEGGFDYSDVRLMEYSSVTWGANEYARTVGMKSLTPDQQKKEITQEVALLEKALREHSYTDDTFLLLELRAQRLKSQLENFFSNQPQATKTLAEIYQSL